MPPLPACFRERLAPPSARWIWSADAAGSNAWVCLRARWSLAAAPTSAPALIAADTHYWLWIDGRLVVRQGGLKRGPTPEDGYVDELDLAPWLHAGEHQVAALVWHLGHDGASHRSSGQGAFLFAAEADGSQLVSDGSWRARRHPAFGQGGEPTTVTLSERGIDLDLDRGWDAFASPSEDDRSWAQAIELGAPPAAPWGRLVARPIPFWSDGERAPYVDQASLGLPCVGPATVTARLPGNTALLPWLRWEGAGEVRVKAERSLQSMRARGAGGPMEAESPAWANGHHVTYEVPAGVMLHDIGWRPTSYATDVVGSFRSSDPRLDLLWERAVRTLRLCLRDTPMDCPDRERSPWIGDFANIVELGHCALDTRFDALVAKTFGELVSWAAADGILWSAVPTGRFRGAYREFPAQSLAAIAVGLRAHWRHRGDRRLLEALYPAIRRYVLEVQGVDEQGLARHRGPWKTEWGPGTQRWYDWGGGADDALLDQGWLAWALEAVAEYARALGRDDDATLAERRREGIATALAAWWDESTGGYRSPRHEGPPDDRGNALAVCAGIADRVHDGALAALLGRVDRAGVFMERYAIDALFQLGRPAEALARLERRYGPHLDRPCTTLPENWGEDGNHAWGGGPAARLMTTLAGVRPLVPGWSEFAVEPVDGGPGQVAVTMPTPFGAVAIELEREPHRWSIGLTVPPGSRARLALPARLARVTLRGPEGTATDRWLPPGRWRITAESA